MQAWSEQDRSGTQRSAVPRTPDRAAAPPPAVPGQHLSPAEVQRLQTAAGNSAVVAMVARARQEEEAPLGKRDGPTGDERSAVPDVLRRPGRPLDAPVRRDMEARFGADFSDVRLHTDGTARASAAQIGARAYTSGSHVVIGDGGGDPHTLAHELTHVLQQRSGPVSGTDRGDGLRLSDPSDHFEREAEASATRVLARPASFPAAADQGPDDGGATPTPGAHAPGAPVVARLMSEEKFHDGARRSAWSRGVGTVADALGAYHAIDRGEYRQRVEALDVLIAEARHVLSRRLGLLTDEEKATVEVLLRQAGMERKVYAGLRDAPPLTSPVERLTRLFELHEIELAAEVEFGFDDAQGFSPPGGWPELVLETVAVLRQQDPAALVDFVWRDVEKLRALSVTPGLPEITRRTLEEVLGHVDLVDFEEGMAGTDRKPAGAARYTVRHTLNQPLGEVERLGSLAHELTHVAAGEAYDNTRMLLLFQRTLTDEQAVQLARQRSDAIAELHVLLDQQTGFSGGQYDLLDNKLRYAQGRKLQNYAHTFRTSGKIGPATKEWALRLDAAIGDGSSTLVEYDTVLTQLLTYLHLWGVPHENRFYERVRTLAEQAHRERQLGSFASWRPDDSDVRMPVV